MNKSMRTGEAYSQGTIPTCVWEVNNHTTSRDFCGWHPTTKNLAVLERIIRAYSDTGDLVCDPFSGSGSTAIAALRLGRDFTGTEMDVEYWKQSQDRVQTLVDDTDSLIWL